MRRHLQEIEDRFRALTENAFDLICEVDERGVYYFLSPNHRQVLGWEISEMLGRCALDYVHPDQRALIEERLGQAAREGSGVAVVQVRTAEGQWRWLEATGQAFQTADGQTRFVIISRDITARREAEERLRREQQLQRRLAALQDADRRLMAYEIHDGLVQDLYGAQLFLESIDAQKALEPDDRRSYESAMRLLRGAIEEARRIINGLRPPILDEQGLVAALEHLIRDLEQTWDIAIDFRADARFNRLSPTVENAVYRIVQECLNNVQKHSGADRASVGLIQEDDRVRIEVADRGCGFDPQTVSERRYGLAGVRDRARLLGGEARIESRPGAGTQVTVLLPVFPVDDPAADVKDG